MSFADELSRNNIPKQENYSDEFYVSNIIEGIKTECRNNQKTRCVRGYVYKHCHSEYIAEYSCYISSLQSKREISAERSSGAQFGEFLYPGDPDADWAWGGPVFPLNESTIRKLYDAFNSLGFTNSKIEIRRVEIERVWTSCGLFNKTHFQKTGRFGYIIFVDIRW